MSASESDGLSSLKLLVDLGSAKQTPAGSKLNIEFISRNKDNRKKGFAAHLKEKKNGGESRPSGKCLRGQGWFLDCIKNSQGEER